MTVALLGKIMGGGHLCLVPIMVLVSLGIAALGSALSGQHLRSPPFVTSQWSLFREAWPFSFALGRGVVTF